MHSRRIQIVTERLFREFDLRAFLDGISQTMYGEIASLSEEQVLNTSSDDLSNYFVEKHRIEPAAIDESGITQERSDSEIEVSGRIDFGVLDRNSPAFVPGTRITLFVPFSGDSLLFRCAPSTFSLGTPRGEVRSRELVLIYDWIAPDIPGAKREIERDLQQIKTHLSRIETQVNEFNSTLRQKADQEIAARREKLLRDRGVVESLGFPLRRRSGVPMTYATPDIKRRIVPRLPSISAQPYTPEPTLDMAEYEHILSIIANMVLVMERSPRAFKGMGEEDLRQHFLVQLNSQYEGRATGETFNFEGRTDILVREKGKNIFIAECKFWAGPSDLFEALDQLLSYTSWRDTKVALLVFNRNTAMTTVLEKVPEVIQKHPSYRASKHYDSETGFRFVLGHRGDKDRELTLTVLVFDVPA